MTTSRDTTNRLAGIASNCREQQQTNQPETSGTESNSRKQQQEGMPETLGTESKSLE
jgi:hypothetical protein